LHETSHCAEDLSVVSDQQIPFRWVYLACPIRNEWCAVKWCKVRIQSEC
jgi:hypothetical protein